MIASADQPPAAPADASGRVVDVARAAAAAVAGVLGDDPIGPILDRWDAEPWRIAVLGRVGVGKTALINALCPHQIGPVGLGGVTTEVRHVSEGLPDGVVLVDTPGIDVPAEARGLLADLLPTIDAVVWVVDGLQPVAASERAVLADLPPGIPLHIVISRQDLVAPEERADVLDRVRRLSAARAPRSVRMATLRGELDLPADLLVREAGSPRRDAALHAALAVARDRLAAIPAPPSEIEVLLALRAAWRDEVREVEAGIESDIARGLVDHKDVARRLFAAAMSGARARFLEKLRTSETPLPPGQPDLPVSEAPTSAPLRDALGAFAGQEGARRVLRAEAGRVAVEGDLALAEWLADGLPEDPVAARVAAALALIDALIPPPA